MSYWLGVLGAWVLADAVSSLYTYTHGEKSQGQSWVWDHSLRLLRAMAGILIIMIGVLL